jgi:hypothetical protein
MTICGYNAQIATGLSSLTDGMIKAIEDRAQSSGMTIEQVLKLEILELRILQESFQGTSNENILLLTRLNGLAQPVFELVAQDLQEGQGEFRECMTSRMSEFIRFVARTEERAARLRREAGHSVEETTAAMQILVEEVMREDAGGLSRVAGNSPASAALITESSGR